MKGYFKKMPGGVLVPDNDETREWLEGVKLGGYVKAELTRPRNYKYLQKFILLVKVGFEYWEPPKIDSKYGTPEKNFERFREMVTIQAGYYHVVMNLDGTARLQADSISFANMNEEDFNKLFSNVVDVLLKKVCTNQSKEDINNHVNTLLSFT